MTLWLRKFFSVVCLAMLIPMSSVLAAEEDAEDDTPDKGDSAVVSSMQAFTESGQEGPGLWIIAAEQANRRGNYEQAIKFCKQALRVDYQDMDLHVIYAEALEKKLKHQHPQDPALFNQCIKEWLMILRFQVGPEKGMDFHGVSPFGRMYEDEGAQVPARYHLIGLAGRAPRLWETNVQYLKRVTKPTTTTEVAGEVIDKKSGKKNKPDKSDNNKDSDKAISTTKDTSD